MNNQWFPSVEVTLPITKLVIEFSEYLTTGQSRELQRLLLRTDIPLDKMGLKGVSGSKAEGFIDMQDRAFEFLFKKAYEIKDGVKVEIETENQIEFVSSLPMEDGNLLYSKVSDLMNGSRLDKDAKKNS